MLTAAAVLSAGVLALSGLSVTAGAEENAAAAAEAPAAENTADAAAETPAAEAAESTAADAAKTEKKKKKKKKKKTEEAAASAASAAEGAPAGTRAAYATREEFVQAQLARSRTDSAFWAPCPPRDIELLTINEYSRPGTAIDTVNTLVIHYVGNAGSTAMDNRNYFESLKDTRDRSASSHFVIGLDGEIVQCIPLSEVAYASRHRNSDTISIECCHPDEDGKFNEYTYWSLVELSAFLCRSFDIDPQTILRHYDVTEKLCPLYYVEHPDEWQIYKDTVEARIKELDEADAAAQQAAESQPAAEVQQTETQQAEAQQAEAQQAEAQQAAATQVHEE